MTAGTVKPLLSVRGLSVGTGPFVAVNDVSFDIQPGEMLALVGESGSGKTATGRAILGLLPPGLKRLAGSITIDGEDLTTVTPARLRELRGGSIGMVFQEPMVSLNPALSIGAQLGEALALHSPMSPEEQHAACLAMLRRIQIPDPEGCLRAYPHEFSGGMRQRVAIALNIACAPKLLIADEPTTALDVTVQQQILALLRDLQRETGMAIILVTHDLHTVQRFCDEVAIMYAGRIVEQGPVAEIFARPAHPYTEGLLRALPQLGGQEDRLPLIPGQPPSLASLPAGCRFAPRCRRATDLCRTEYPDWMATAGETRRSACWYADEVLG